MSVHDKPWPDGTPCWAELAVPDLEAGRRFYGDLLGWEFEVGPEETGFYSEALVGGRRAAALSGVMPGGGADGPAAWLTFLAASDVRAAVERAVAAGAEVLAGPVDVMDFGAMAVLRDPTGATFALWQAGISVGAQVVNEPGAMIWNEHLSPRFEDAKEFYRAAFGYALDDISAPGFDYVTLLVEGRAVGGVGGGGEPPEWAVYVAVPDTDATAAAAVRLGGAVFAQPEDTPYGRLAGITGPFGERFWLMSTDEPSSPPAG
jgi:predicted enzyme related to lactoylglutathione lyase